MEQINDLAQFNDKRVLVFGGHGFIGSTFIRALFQNSPRAIVLCADADTYSGNPANLADIRGRFADDTNPHDLYQLSETLCDISHEDEVDAVFDMFQPEFVINFAAETHVDKSIHTGSKVFIDTNVTGVFNILEAIKKMSVMPRFVQVSTDEVYGQLPNPYDYPDAEGIREPGESMRTWARRQKFTRNSPFKPNVPYSATKAGGDALCNAYHHTWHVPVMVTHCSNNYGPYQYPEKLVPFWATRLLRGEKIPMYGDGMNIRDWIHVDDHVTALAAVLMRGEPGKDYLIGADNERSNIEMAQIIVDIMLREFKGVHAPNVDEQIEFVKDRPGHDRRYAIDASDTTKELGWTPKYGREEFVAAMRETLRWYADHTEWMQEIIKRTGVANPHIDLWKAHNIT